LNAPEKIMPRFLKEIRIGLHTPFLPIAHEPEREILGKDIPNERKYRLNCHHATSHFNPP
jgi:hypothetical protein